MVQKLNCSKYNTKNDPNWATLSLEISPTPFGHHFSSLLLPLYLELFFRAPSSNLMDVLLYVNKSLPPTPTTTRRTMTMTTTQSARASRTRGPPAARGSCARGRSRGSRCACGAKRARLTVDFRNLQNILGLPTYTTYTDF